MMSYSNYFRILLATASLLAGVLLPRPVTAQEKVDVVVGADAPALEQLAARELAEIMKRVLGCDANVVNSFTTDAVQRVVIGSSNSLPVGLQRLPALAALKAESQLIESVRVNDRPAWLIAGGSPQATLWAVSELAHFWGERAMLFGDLRPIQPPANPFENLQMRVEPRLAVRSWTLLGDSLLGTETWSLESVRGLLKQLAKQKYNRVELVVNPAQPFVRLQLDGIAKSSAVLQQGETFEITGETAGRSAFSGADRFENPDLARFRTSAERLQGGIEYLRAVMTSAEQWGLQPAICFAPTSLPSEYQAIAGGILRHVESRPARLVMPLDTDNANARQTLLKLAEQQLLAYLDTYPDVHLLGLSFQDAPHLLDAADQERVRASLAAWGWNPLSPRFEKVWTAARAGSERDTAEGVRRKLGSLLLLAFLETLLEQPAVKSRLQSQAVRVYFADLPGSLAAPITELVTPETELVFSGGDAETLATLPTRGSIRVSLTSSEPNVLPLRDLPALATTLQTLVNRSAQGVYVEGLTVSDLDLASYYVSRVAGGEPLAAEAVYDRLLTPVCGEGVADRVMRAMQAAEQVQGPWMAQLAPFGTPDGNLLQLPAESPEKVKEALTAAQGHYLAAMNEMYRANTRAREGGRAFTLYFARRFEFAFELMNAAIALQAAQAATVDADQETATAEEEKALESLYGGLNALAAVARNPGDRAVIAVVNQFAFGPLSKKLAEQ
jgi:hypothetical protein